MQLPVDEEDDEKVMRVPEPLEMGATSLLDGKKHHDTKGGGHNPSSNSWACEKVGTKEGHNDLASSVRVWVSFRKLSKVYHMS